MNPLYSILHLLVRITLPLYYRKIHVNGLENVPTDKPILLAVNHQNAFLDGVLVAYKLKRQIYFLTRSDVFKGKWAGKILRSMNLVPIYRSQDGTGVENNKEVFKWCYKTLQENKPVLIFPEGTCEPHKHMFSLKKGMARIALGAVESFPNMDLQVVPVALNYSNHMDFRSTVWVDFAPPVSVKNIVQSCSSSGECVKLLTKKVEDELRKIVLHIDKENYHHHNEIVMHNIEVYEPISAAELQKISKHEKSEKNELAPKPVRLLSDSKFKIQNFLSFFLLLIHRPLYFFIDFISAKITGKNEFFPSVKYALLSVAFPIYWLLLASAITVFLGASISIFFIILMCFPITAWLGLTIRE